MKNTLLASAIALAGVFGFAGAASAQSAIAETEVELTVPNTCGIETDPFVSMSLFGFSPDGIENNDQEMPQTIGLGCNEDTPYTLETNAEVGGVIDLIGQSTGSIVPMRVTKDEVPLGSLANGEEFSGVGHGNIEWVPVQLVFNVDDDGLPLPLPPADVYSATITYTLSW